MNLKNCCILNTAPFNTTDLLYFMLFLKFHYTAEKTLETAFTKWMNKKEENIENALNGFHHYFILPAGFAIENT